MECSQFRGVWFTRSGRLHCAPVVWRAEPEDARDWHHRHQRQNLMRSLDCARLDGGGHALRDQRNARLRHARSIDRNGIYHAACAANAAQSCATGSVRRSRRCARSLLARLQTKRAVRKIAYGIGEPGGAPPADTVLRATAPRTTATGSAFMLISDWGRGEVETHLLGTFNIHNLLAVCGALLAADVPFEAALAQLPKLAPISGRMQCVGGRNGAPLAVIDYAHTPGALGA